MAEYPNSYSVHGNVIEHTAEPRFHTVVVVHDGQTAGIRRIEWVGSHNHVTAVHAQFLAATALLAWSLRHQPPSPHDDSMG